jgi:hypothetical protein
MLRSVEHAQSGELLLLLRLKLLLGLFWRGNFALGLSHRNLNQHRRKTGWNSKYKQTITGQTGSVVSPW